MRRLLLGLLALFIVSVIAAALYGLSLAGPKFDERLAFDPLANITIAPSSEALTFARIATERGERGLLVTAASGSTLRAIDLADVFGPRFADPILAATQLDLDQLTSAAATVAGIEVPYSDLILPFEASYPHIAAGTNYRAHAEEVGHDDEPFLFPKLSHATAWNSNAASAPRLDYEAELCAVTLTEHTREAPARMGFTLCNDFTDRWRLVRDLDLSAPMGTTGFPSAKGGEGRLPIGPFLVVPHDPDSFYREVELSLYVNGELRQRESAGLMIWSPAEILTRSLAACSVAFDRAGETLNLTPCTGIAPRTLILTGTPGGVMFDLWHLWYPGAYLAEGDEILTIGTHLGVLRNQVQ